jgi:hypothetical protein
MIMTLAAAGGNDWWNPIWIRCAVRRWTSEDGELGLAVRVPPGQLICQALFSSCWERKFDTEKMALLAG